MHTVKTAKKSGRRRRLALLLPGHNEELILATTIQSALTAGVARNDIYVVDDDSSDKTPTIARKLLPRKNVLTVPRSGKAGAVVRAIAHFNIVRRYTWVHVADADSIFCPDYFRIYRQNLNVKKWSVAVGFVQSMHGNWIANYRSFTYTYGQHIFRRVQSWLGVISVLPGPVTCFQTNIIKHLDFNAETLTEDFDLTLQVHRKKLGRIRFIPEAVNYTQDPQTLKDFIVQSQRWQRGFFQGVKKHHIGLRPHMIDVGIGYQVFESMYYTLQLLVIIPLLIVTTQSLTGVVGIIIADFVIVVLLAIFSASIVRRPSILRALLYFYILRFVELAIFIMSFIEIIVLRRFQVSPVGWQTEGRRYEIPVQVRENGDSR